MNLRRKEVPASALAKLDTFAAVLSGDKKVAKVSPRMAAGYRDAGIPVYGNRVIIPSSQYVVTSGSEKGFIKSTKQRGDFKVTKTLLPVGPMGMEQYIEAQREIDPDYKLPKGKVFAFTFYGNQSYDTYPSLQALWEAWNSYPSVSKASDHVRDNMIRNLEIVHVTRSRDWFAEGKRKRKANEREKQKRRNRARKLVPRSELSESQLAAVREYDRQRKRLSYDRGFETARKALQREAARLTKVGESLEAKLERWNKH